ncbi:MAG: serine/threonine protein kinase [Acidimicrobiales bacterium]|nr:serine/threonine protein kinase [Acidimicrobiales bacterium]
MGADGGRAAEPPWTLARGATLADGRYEVLSVLGRGGFGVTYEVGDRRLLRRVAIKELFPPDAVRDGEELRVPPEAAAAFDAQRARFLREARVLARFTHPGIVRVYEVFEEHGTAHLVMERLDGQTLVDVLVARGAPFTEVEVLDVAARVAAALRPVHAAGVLHRDINPANVMLAAHGRIVVIDFGLARDYEPDRTVGMTRVVTPGYAPIEQYRGEARFGPATDVYGLAATCYRLATGRIPAAALDREGGAVLVPVRELNPAISREVADAIADGLELEPGHRPADLDAFLARLGVRSLPDGSASVLAGSAGTEVAAPSEATELAPAPERHASGTADAPGADVGEVGPTDAAVAVAPPMAEGRWPALDHGVPGDPDATVVPGIGRTPRPDDTVVGTAAAARPGPDATRVEEPTAYASPVAFPPTPAAGSAPDVVRRWPATAPVAAALVGLGAALPVAATAVVLLAVLPVLATIGDADARRLRLEVGVEPGWADRHLPSSVSGIGRFLRNLVVAVLRSSPIVGIAALLLGGWYALDATSAPAAITEWLLRLVGAATVAALLASAREGTARFRSGIGIDAVAARLVSGGRFSERVVVLWLLAVVVVAASLWLTPDPLPLP